MRKATLNSLVQKPQHQKSYAKGSLLLVSQPFAFVLSSSQRGKNCDGCLQPRDALKRCSRCQFLFYCSVDCQRTDWAEHHRAECANLQRVRPKQPSDTVRLMARIVLRLRANKNYAETIGVNGGGGGDDAATVTKRSRCFRDLMSHYSDLKHDRVRLERFECLSVVLREFLGAECGVTMNEADLLGLFGRMCVNSFSICDAEMQSIGTGIYLAATILDHSCQPNAVAVFEGKTLRLRAIEDLGPELDWSKVFISYIDLMSPTADRRRELRDGYYFECGCKRCAAGGDSWQRDATMSSVLCPSCKAPIVRPPLLSKEDVRRETLLCEKCSCWMTTDDLEVVDEAINFARDRLKEMEDTVYLDACELCLRKLDGLVHPLNILRVKVLDAAFDSAINLQKWNRALELGVEVLPAYRRYYDGACHPLLAVHLLKVGKLELFLDRFAAAFSHFEESLSILSVTHGDKHPFVTATVKPLLQEAQHMQLLSTKG